MLVFAGFWGRKAIIWQTVQAHVFWHRDDDVTWLAQCDFVVSRGFQAVVISYLHTLFAQARLSSSHPQHPIKRWLVAHYRSEQPGLVVWCDVHLVEEHLVEHAPDVLRSLPVGDGHVLGNI
ncbi:hypothetical protein BKH27_06075 [Actinomyces oris]|uniref:Uncharacterized protein n=1 Tax=Actinomyces oris TaxID=544580 RepID=A0A1Q8VYP6_9ACTO|nr:hypothetical protein [Actinomyces oris]OLO53578.1 hypothetical protein BKH27_06075 [Actinomyces oris]